MINILDQAVSVIVKLKLGNALLLYVVLV